MLIECLVEIWTEVESTCKISSGSLMVQIQQRSSKVSHHWSVVQSSTKSYNPWYCSKNTYKYNEYKILIAYLYSYFCLYSLLLDLSTLKGNYLLQQTSLPLKMITVLNTRTTSFNNYYLILRFELKKNSEVYETLHRVLG